MYFSSIPHFEKHLRSVAQRFIREIILYRHLQSLLYPIVIAAVLLLNVRN